MENRFKFRAWIPEAKHLRSEAKGGMFYQEDQYLYSFIRRIQDQFIVNHPSYLPFELEDRLMQSIGEKDINDNLIYEGDIVKEGDSFIKVIEWDEQYAGYGLDTKAYSYEILGNIYQHKHLLDDAK